MSYNSIHWGNFYERWRGNKLRLLKFVQKTYSVVVFKMPMALSTQQGLEDSQYLLLAKIDNARNVSNILKAIHFKDVRMK